ncbi:hypothetical protein [Micromonospora chersina]|uniref:hypothetical protein n=1 Tax=Micromonospora chersina TaxID=47854 RepID=UPI00371CAF21
MAALTMGAAAPALAVEDPGADGPQKASGSNWSGFSNGARLYAEIWIATWASGGCADWTSSAFISGGTNPVANRDWIKNTTKFDPWGISPSVTAFGQSGDPIQGSWTNNNGSRGSYMSGSLCTNWRTVGVTGYETATAYYNGQTKVVTAST